MLVKEATELRKSYIYMFITYVYLLHILQRLSLLVHLCGRWLPVTTMTALIRRINKTTGYHRYFSRLGEIFM